MDFSAQLIIWYLKNKRDLPWRNTSNPYFIWLSEIILQQTRVDQGLSYYHKFIKRHPTISSLANSNEEDVLKLWQGLGYYSRARNLHFTAKYINHNHKGKFPNTYKEILALKGIGEYTAAAISSFAYQLPYPVIDGNVYRVLSRIFGVKTAIDTSAGKKVFKELANELIDKNNAATYNQAIMEFGAVQCKPKKPNCEVCPFLLECEAYKNKSISELPVKEKKIKQRNRYFNYLVIENDNAIYLNKREQKDIWEGLFDFPLIETSNRINNFDKLPLSSLKEKITHSKVTLNHVSEEYKHILSHQKIHATFWKVTLNKSVFLGKKSIAVPLDEVNKFPVPKLIENYLKTIL
jgi:A/G-specific adenine glycosylase